MSEEQIEINVPIPGEDGRTIVRTVKVQVEAEYDAILQDYVLDGHALNVIERVKAREIGVLLPEEIRALRERLGMTQKELAELLQIGAKTWSRWENERERPSRSMNILLRALNDGKLDVPYLKSLREKPSWLRLFTQDEHPARNAGRPVTAEIKCPGRSCPDGLAQDVEAA